MKSMHARKHIPEDLRNEGRAGGGEDPKLGLPLVWPGLSLMTPWLEFWGNYWAHWLGRGFSTTTRRPARRHSGEPERRQEEALPWVPKVETTVIPLRRRTDPPGQQAAKISMELRVPALPWLGGGNVISMDAFLPRDQEAEAEAPSPEGKSDWR